MKLEELSAEYLDAAEKCRTRALELRRQLPDVATELEAMRLRRRINMLIEMAGETHAVGNYLANYYHGRTNDGRTDLLPGDGVREHAEADAHSAGGQPDGGAHRRRPAQRAHTPAGAAGNAVLRGAAQHAGDRHDAWRKSLYGVPDAAGCPEEAAPMSALQQQNASAGGRMK